MNGNFYIHGLDFKKEIGGHPFIGFQLLQVFILDFGGVLGGQFAGFFGGADPKGPIGFQVYESRRHDTVVDKF